jgi:hypothetical protein
MGINMGIGAVGLPGTIYKRKFRWTFQVDFCGNEGIPANFVKVAARPNLAIEETEINFLNSKTWISGKAAWETITVTYLDVAGDQSAKILSWLASVYNFAVPVRTPNYSQGAALQDYEGTATLTMYDGCGETLEEWRLQHVWPTAVNFGELDYSSSDIAEIELTLRYSDVQYRSSCAGQIAPCSCTRC